MLPTMSLHSRSLPLSLCQHHTSRPSALQLQDGPLDAIREPRDGLFVLLGLLPPKRVAKAPHAESTAQAEDENAHYRALVEDAARGL